MEKLASIYSSRIRCFLARMGVEGIQVEDRIREEDAKEYQNQLNLGWTGIGGESVSLLIASDGAKSCDPPINFLLVPPLPQGSLLADRQNGALAADFFFELRNGAIRPTLCREPLLLDGIDNIHERDPDGGIGPESLAINGKTLAKLTGKKLATKEILLSAGIPTPAFREIEPGDYADLPRLIRNFCEDVGCRNFVVKGDTGCCGEQVGLFHNSEIDSGAEFANHLSKKGYTVFLEERKFPLSWIDRQGRLLDWNIRAFVACGSFIECFDAEVRYRPFSDKLPVNISRGALVADLEYVARITGASMERIKRVCIETAQALYEEIPLAERAPGLLGLDLMVCEDAIHVIEANAGGVGGFFELTQVRKKPMESFLSFLRSAREFLQENHSRPKIDLRLDALPARDWERMDIAQLFSETGNAEEAARIYLGEMAKSPDDPDALSKLVPELMELKRFEEALEYVDKLMSICESSSTHFVKGMILLELGKKEEEVLELEKAIELDAGNAKALAYLAVALYNDGNPNESAAAEVASLMHDIVVMDMELNKADFFCCARVCDKLGNLEDAVALYKKAIGSESDSDYREAHLPLFLALVKLGRDSEVLEHYQRALQVAIEDGNDELVSLLRRVEMVEMPAPGP